MSDTADHLDLVEVPISHSPIRAGARLFAWMAFPQDEATRRMEEQKLTRSSVEEHLGLGQIPEGITPEEILSVRLRPLFASQRIENALRRRLSAAHLAMPFAMELEGHNFAERKEAILSELDKDPENFDKFYWKASAPVLHVACAYAQLANFCGRQGYKAAPQVVMASRPMLTSLMEMAGIFQLTTRKAFPRLFEANAQVTFIAT